MSQENTQAVVVSEDSVAKVNFSIEQHELEQFRKRFIKEKQKQVVLRGFRKGKAPEEMVARFFKDEANESAKNNAVFVKYSQLLQEHKLQPLTKPTLDELREEDDKICVSLSVEVLQPVVLGQYLGLEVQKMPERTVADGAKLLLGEIRHKYPKLTPVDAAAVNGNVAVVDFAMFNGEKELESQKDFKVALGLNLFFKDFETQIVGMKAGESKEFNLHFPVDYPNESLKNKDVRFVMSAKVVNEVGEYTNDELAELLGYKTYDKMLEALAQEVEMKYKDEEHQFYENQLLGQLLSAHSFKVPKRLIDDETKRILVEKPDMDNKQAAEIADRFMRTDLVLRAIYERHPDIHLKQDDVNAKIAELASRANDSVEGTIKKLQDSGKLNMYLNYLANARVIDFLIDMAEKKEMKPPVVNESGNVVIETEKEKDNG